MKVKVFYPDKNGRISFTKKELQDLLDEVYREGYNDAKPYYWTWTTPYVYGNWSNGTVTSTNTSSTLNSSNYSTATTTSSGKEGDVLQYHHAPEPEPYKIEFEDAS